MRRRSDGGWDLGPNRIPVVRALAAAAVLAVLGAVVGGIVGWMAFMFFSVACVALITQAVSQRPVVTFDQHGVVLSPARDRRHIVPWDDVEALLLWSGPPGEGGHLDHLGVVTSFDLPRLTGPTDATPDARLERLDPEEAVPINAPLADCRLDTYQLRAVLLGFGSRAVVVDRRL
jgi:hypothetical protein